MSVCVYVGGTDTLMSEAKGARGRWSGVWVESNRIVLVITGLTAMLVTWC